MRLRFLLLRQAPFALFILGALPEHGDAFELKNGGGEDQDQNAQQDELPDAAEGGRESEEPVLAHVAANDLLLGDRCVVDGVGVAAGQISAVVQDPDDAVRDHHPRDLRVFAVVADDVALPEIRRGVPVYDDVVIREDGGLHAAGEHLEHGSAEYVHDVALRRRDHHIDQQRCRKDQQNRYGSVQDPAKAALAGLFPVHFLITQPFPPAPV